MNDKPKKDEDAAEIQKIRERISELDKNFDFGKNPAAKREYRELQTALSELLSSPEETVGMKRLKDLSADEQKEAFENYAKPRTDDAKKGDGNPRFVEHWKDMTFERWIEEAKDSFLEHTMPALMKDMPRAFGPFGSIAGWMSFRGKCIANCDIISDELRNESYQDMTPDQMLDYANRLEEHAKEWEQKNPELYEQVQKNKDKLKEWEKDNDWTITLGMDEAKKKEHMQKMRKKYGNEFIGLIDVLKESKHDHYDVLKDAISWLRFWGEKGHGMHAWY